MWLEELQPLEMCGPAQSCPTTCHLRSSYLGEYRTASCCALVLVKSAELLGVAPRAECFSASAVG